MTRDYLLVALLVIYPLGLLLFGKKPNKPVTNHTRFYLRGSIEPLAIPLLFLALDPKAYMKLDFTQLGRGFFNESIFAGLIPIFVVPLVMSIFRSTSFAPSKEETPRLFGYPIKWLPTNQNELSTFALYILIGVTFEELVFRQVAFYALFKVFNLKGDLLLIATAVLFTIGHPYRKPWQIISIFFIGLMLGKSFQFSGTILWPIALHLCMNTTLIILAAKRLGQRQPSR